MTWKNVTVRQWQELCDLYTGDAEDIKTPTISILTGMTEAQVDSLSAEEREDLLKKFNFIHEMPDGVPQKFIEVNGRRYRCVYDVRQIKAARYIESKHFASDPNGNLHRIAASMIHPQRRGWLGWKDDRYDAARHEEYANDMLDAPVTAVLGSVLFFCEVYRAWIKSSEDYLVKEMISKGIQKQEAEILVTTLSTVMDGTIMLKLSPSMNG